MYWWQAVWINFSGKLFQQLSLLIFVCRISLWLVEYILNQHNSNFACEWRWLYWQNHYCDIIMGMIASQITSLTIVYSTVYLLADQRKHQRSTSLAFGWGIHRGPVNSPHKWPVTRKMFPFDDVIMCFPSYDNIHSIHTLTRQLYLTRTGEQNYRKRHLGE